jgi:hypothetical protein
VLSLARTTPSSPVRPNKTILRLPEVFEPIVFINVPSLVTDDACA